MKLISVILPCYNADKHLTLALNSIINQTYSNLEIITINDGSSDKTLNILKSYAEKDSRIIIIDNIKNVGLVKSLNKGILKSRGDYIARMDADDISFLNRFENQKKYLEIKKIDLLSSGFVKINGEGQVIGKSFNPVSQPNSCFYQSFFKNPILHPSLFIKTEILKKNLYGGTNTEHTEDFELWNRLAAKGFKIGNIKAPLLYYRVSPNSISNKYDKIQKKNHILISQKAFERFHGIKISLLITQVVNNNIVNKNTFTDLYKAVRILISMKKIFLCKSTSYLERFEINQSCSCQIIDICVQGLLKLPIKLKVPVLLILLIHAPQIIKSRSYRYLISKIQSSH